MAQGNSESDAFAICSASLKDEFEDAEYQGKKVILNKPFRTSGESKKFAVYVKNDKGNVVIVRFGDPKMEIKRDDKEARANFRARHNCSEQKDKTSAAYWSCRMWSSKPVSEITDCGCGCMDSETIKGGFNDSLSFDSETKTAISFRDGVLRYLGSELGLEPANKEFTVYRSPATIANAASKMKGIPLTDEHVSLDYPPEQPVGSVEESEMIDLFDQSDDSTVGVKNSINVTDLIKGALQTGKRQLSLGYGADLVPHDKWDFEQRNILPHHLAVVQAGRCGPACSFTDRKPLPEDNTMAKEKNGQQADKPAENGQAVTLIAPFMDADGAPNLEQIVEIAQGLPEALRKLPVDKLQEVMPQLQEIVAMASGSMGDMPAEDMEAEDMEKDGEKEEMQDGDKMEYTDSAAFKDAVAQAVADNSKELSTVIDKAKNFVDADYSYTGKTADQIMRDALATQHDKTQFEDSELKVAFKLLKPAATNMKKFGDGINPEQADQWEAAADKDL